MSYSKISSYINSPVDYYFKYIERLRPKKVQPALYKGSMLHELFEQRALHKIDPEKHISWEELLDGKISDEFYQQSESNREELGDLVEDARKILRQYDWHYANENVVYSEDKLEMEFEVVLYAEDKDGNPVDEDSPDAVKQLILVGFIDGIVTLEGKPNEQYILEHKTFKKNPKSLSEAWIDLQTSIYATVLNKKYGFNIVGVLWDMVKSVPYTEPKILKNGSFGKQPSTVTLLSFDSNPGEDIIEEVKDNHLNFLQRFTTPLIPSAIEIFMNEVIEVGKELLNGCVPKHLHLRKLDNWSKYKPIIEATLLGQDVDYIIESLYERKEEEKEDELPSEEDE